MESYEASWKFLGAYIGYSNLCHWFILTYFALHKLHKAESVIWGLEQ